MTKKALLALTATITLGCFGGSAMADESIPPGEYECRESSEYKFKPCTVKEKDGEVILTTTGSLFAFEAVLVGDDSEKVITLDGKPTDARRFGCFSCAEGASKDPNDPGCTELPETASTECMQTPLVGYLEKSGDKWKGRMILRMYSNEYGKDGDKKTIAGTSTELQAFELTVRKKK